jgi:hypothetical protein
MYILHHADLYYLRQTFGGGTEEVYIDQHHADLYYLRQTFGGGTEEVYIDQHHADFHLYILYPKYKDIVALFKSIVHLCRFPRRCRRST